MKWREAVLFLIPTLIWGSTWYAIKFQIGLVHPLVSVALRFLLASGFLFLYCIVFGLRLRFSFLEHRGMFLLGLFLFGFNYWLVYEAEKHLTSGLVAVVFSGLIFMNIFLGTVFLKAPLRARVAGGAVLGIIGISMVFHKEIATFGFRDRQFGALVLAVVSVVLASTGNILSAMYQKRKLPVVQANAYGMLYGASAVLLLALILGVDLTIDYRVEYLGSLLYLSLFGSVVAFGAYLKLLGEAGPDRAGYVSMVMPVIALLLSTLFEGYVWTPVSAAGLPLILGGYIIALRSR